MHRKEGFDHEENIYWIIENFCKKCLTLFALNDCMKLSRDSTVQLISFFWMKQSFIENTLKIFNVSMSLLTFYIQPLH